MNFRFEGLIKEKYGLDIIDIKKNLDSTDGNVYILKTKNDNYIIKIYNKLTKLNSMIELYTYLNDKINIPNIIKTIDGKMYINYDNKYIVVYSYMPGIQLNTYLKEKETYDRSIIKMIAKEVRKMHDNTVGKDFGLEKIIFANNLKRKSMLHFDLTKGNIFVSDKKIGLIDFDDAKYGDSICDVAILLCFLFISKSKGADKEGAKIFIDSYYNNDEKKLKKEEAIYIKEYAKKWVDYLLDGHEFDSSLKDSFEFKKGNVDKLM